MTKNFRPPEAQLKSEIFCRTTHGIYLLAASGDTFEMETRLLKNIPDACLCYLNHIF
jgi:hypothetical protein